MGVKERKESNRQRIQADIIDAGEQIFFSEGIQKATMDRIAALAEVSKTTLYNYYKSKTELIVAINIKGARIHEKQMVKIFESGDSVKNIIKDILLSYVEFYEAFPQYFDIANYLIANKVKVDELNETLKREHEEIEASFTNWLDLFDRGKAEGVIRKDVNPLNVGILSWLQMRALLTSDFVLQEIEASHNITKKELLDEHFTIIFNGILEPSHSI